MPRGVLYIVAPGRGSNQEVAMSVANGIAVRLRSDHQHGLFVLRQVRKDETLITYDGPTIDHPTRYSIQIDDGLHIYLSPDQQRELAPLVPEFMRRRIPPQLGIAG